MERDLNAVGFQDDATWGRLLTIVNDLLEQTRRTEISGHAGLQGLFESIIWPGFRHENRQVSTLGLKAMALFALLDRDTAQRMMPMLLMAAADESATLVEQSIAMRAITDLLMRFEDLLETPAKKVQVPTTVTEGDEIAAAAEGNEEDAAAAAAADSSVGEH